MSANEKNAKFGHRGSCGGLVAHFWNFGTPLSPKALRLGTSNLAWRWTAVSTNGKNTKLSQNGLCGSRGTISQFLDSSISERIQARNFKFGTELHDNLC